jgi:predicted nucleotidyltransferase
MYLFGSLALGAFNAGSDIDYVVVTENPLATAVVAQLAALHDQIAALPNRFATEIEASYIPRQAFRRYDVQDRIHPHLDRGQGERLVPQWTHEEDWIVQRYVLYQHGKTITGPDVRTLLDPVSADELRSAVSVILRDWWLPMVADDHRLQKSSYQTYAVLSLCRIAYTLQQGDVISKLAAASWMLDREPRYASLIQRALKWQLTREDIASTQQLIALVATIQESK